MIAINVEDDSSFGKLDDRIESLLFIAKQAQAFKYFREITIHINQLDTNFDFYVRMRKSIGNLAKPLTKSEPVKKRGRPVKTKVEIVNPPIKITRQESPQYQKLDEDTLVSLNKVNLKRPSTSRESEVSESDVKIKIKTKS